MAGSEMRGGQWQVLRLIEGLAAAGVESTLLARAGAPLFRGRAANAAGAWSRWASCGHCAAGAPPRPGACARCARPHAGRLAGGAPLVVSRRVAFPVGSRWKYGAPAALPGGLGVREVGAGGGRRAGGKDQRGLRRRAAARAGSRGDRGAGAGQSRTIRKRARRWRWKRRGWPASSCDFPATWSATCTKPRVFVYITHSEGLGSGALLAMSAGVPVIASRVGGSAGSHPRIARTGCWWKTNRAAIAAAIRELAGGPRAGPPAGRARRGSAVIENFHRGPHGPPYHGSLPAGALMMEAYSRAAVRTAHRQLPERVHLPLAARSFGGAAALALRRLREDRSPGTTTCPW